MSTLYSDRMRPHLYGVTVLLIASLAGCGGNAEPAGEAPSPTAHTGTIVVSPLPSPPAAPHTLVFKATGTAAVTSVVYELDGAKTTEKSVKLPYRKAVQIPADGKRHTWSLTMKQGSGRVDLTATVDGVTAGRSSGQADGGTGTVSVDGELRG